MSSTGAPAGVNAVEAEKKYQRATAVMASKISAVGAWARSD
jgi:hypothetical protein